MVAISSHFILLHAVFQNILYIYRPDNSTDAFLCLDMHENEKAVVDNSCPSIWVKMTSHLINNNIPAFTAPISNITKKYKIKINFNDGVFKELGWSTLSNNNRTPPINIYSNSNSEYSVIGLLCYLAICSTILLFKCMLRAIKNKKCLLMLTPL